MEQKQSVRALLQRDAPLTKKAQLRALIQLSLPAIFAQLTSIMMQYIDAAMVGALGAEASAAIGVVSTSTWLLSGLCTAAASGFSVQVAQRIGAADEQGARSVVKHGLLITLLFALALSFSGSMISSFLPGWLGADPSLHADASGYFLIYVCALPFLQMSLLGAYLLQCSGDMKVPSI
ncbi:MAG: MATE family efflux transporter, partial [Merdibacter sp.]